MASREIAKGLSKRQTLKELKLAQQDKVYKWSMAMCSKGKPVSGFMATEKARRFCDGIKLQTNAHSMMADCKILKDLGQCV